MSGVFDFLAKEVGSTVRGAESLVSQQWSQRMVQVSVYAGVVFYVLSTYELISFVEKQLISIGLRVGKDGTRLVHAVIFAVFMYYGSRLILDPVVSRIQGKQPPNQ
tara:strand:+ start:268 stop:585 length:318 start_codon:yes stop_codon:yes gene_type:complete